MSDMPRDSTTSAPALPVLTAAATRQAGQLIAAAGDPATRLRVRVDGGGCSGFQYTICLDAECASDDMVADRAGVGLVVDALSQPYLAGAEIDYVEAFAGNRFVVRNPHAHMTCSCGTSFSV